MNEWQKEQNRKLEEEMLAAKSKPATEEQIEEVSTEIPLTEEELQLLKEMEDELEAEQDTSDDINLNVLFSNNTSSQSSTANQLVKTAELTTLSESIRRTIWKELLANPAMYSTAVRNSIKSHDEMDMLINLIHKMDDVDIEFLKVETEDTLDKMIRSQQSKRSRSKSKEMTELNYQTMMTGAIAENLLRLALNKPKSSGGLSIGDDEYTIEDIQKMTEFPEELTKAIRNVQSKKSILRGKQGFEESNPRFMKLLEIEKHLKSLRNGADAALPPEATQAIESRKNIEDILTKSASMTKEELLAAMQEALATK